MSDETSALTEGERREDLALRLEDLASKARSGVLHGFAGSFVMYSGDPLPNLGNLWYWFDSLDAITAHAFVGALSVLTQDAGRIVSGQIDHGALGTPTKPALKRPLSS